MSYKISKELFEAVMDVKKECYLQDIELIDENKIIYSYLVDEQFQEPRYDEELINDFFFKCKEWALSKGYELDSSLYKGYDNDIWGNCEIWITEEKLRGATQATGFVIDIEADSEQQVVFNACQWILDNKEK